MKLSLRHVALVQGLYYLLTGLWPLVHMSSFEFITGRKTDHWLVNTAGGLIAVIGGTLTLGAIEQRLERQTAVLATSSALFLAAIEVLYTARGRIRLVYLLDALLEGLLVAAWLRAWRTAPGTSTSTP